MPAPPRPERLLDPEAAAEWIRLAEPNDAMLGLISQMHRLQTAVDKGEVAIGAAGLTVLSLICRDLDQNKISAAEFFKNIVNLSEETDFPVVIIPYRIFFELANGWLKYMHGGHEPEIKDCLKLRKRPGQGVGDDAKSCLRILEKFSMAHDVVNYRAAKSLNEKELSDISGL